MNSGELVQARAISRSDLIEAVQSTHSDRTHDSATRLRQPVLIGYWHVILKRKFVLAACVLVAMFLVTLHTLKATRLYEAVGRIQVTRQNSDALGLKETTATSGDYWDYSVALETHVKILQGDILALQIIKNLQLDQNPYFAGSYIRQRQPQSGLSTGLANFDLSPVQEAALLKNFHRSLSVVVLPRTQLIEVHFLSPEPQVAANVVNALASSYIEHNFKTKYESTSQAANWLSGQLADLQMRVESSQEKLVRYQREHGIFGLDEKQNIVTAKLDQLNKELTSAGTDRIQKEAAYLLVQSDSPEIVSKIDPLSLIQKLRTQQIDLQNQYAQLTTRFDSSYPKVQELDNQLSQINAAIENELAKMKERTKNEYLSALRREKMLGASLDAQKQEDNKLNQKTIQFTLLKHDADSNRQLYDSLLQKLKETEITAGLKSNDTQIIEVARVPAKPVKPNIPNEVGLGLLLGLVGGITLSFIIEGVDNTVRTPDQVEAITELSCFAFIPTLKRKLDTQAQAHQHLLPSDQPKAQTYNMELISFLQPNSQIAEAFRALRTSILLSSTGTAPKVILVTSALANEGKTTVSINIAIVLAQSGARVLIVDTDLRRSGVDRKLGTPCALGLSHYLSGRASLQDIIIPSRQVPNLSVVAAGPLPPQPAAMLGSLAMKAFLNKCREQFDHIIIDSPPVLAITDAVLLSVEADSVLLVARSGLVHRQSLLRVRDLLMGVSAKLIGVILNGVDLKSPDFSSYGYGYYVSPAGDTEDIRMALANPENVANGICTTCGLARAGKTKFCAGCGNAVHGMEYCAKCRSKLEREAEFCLECGAIKTLRTGNGLWSETIDHLVFTFTRDLAPDFCSTCSDCGTILSATNNFCTQCGSSHRRTANAEHQKMTFMEDFDGNWKETQVND